MGRLLPGSDALIQQVIQQVNHYSCGY
uniref:Uncharacterized protein n=1 Tax=Anguilla anguilla TaxID=7936 RepID=A0A0E9SYQ7_ANGAN